MELNESGRYPGTDRQQQNKGVNHKHISATAIMMVAMIAFVCIINVSDAFMVPSFGGVSTISSVRQFQDHIRAGRTLSNHLGKHREIHLWSDNAGADAADIGGDSTMEDLILSLSVEPSDESRRGRLVSIFEMELSKENGAQEFADQFGLALNVVGARVQDDARGKALKKREEAEALGEEPLEPEPLENKSSDVPIAMGHTAEEQQLWALIDMMIQSKTIVKKTFGDLGTKGQFQ
eukprot:scaffold55228_cov62-Attheya_sp.AAC.1